MSQNDEADPLEALLAFAETEFDKTEEKEREIALQIEKKTEIEPLKSKQSKTLTEIDLFGPQDDEEPSLLHKGDTDSSDDEDNRNPEEQRYNECGKQIKQLLTTVDQNRISTSHYGQPKQRISTWKDKHVSENNIPVSHHKPLLKKTIKPHTFGSVIKIPETKPQDVLIDPFFGIRIVNPLISHSTIVDRMQGREAVQLSTIQRFLIRNCSKDKDWVICGVIVGKSPVKTSQKGSQYSIWTLSDLKSDIKTVALFLFSGAHKDLWKTNVGTVIGVLNPGVLDRKDGSKDEATLSVDNAQKVMMLGQSKDYGLCKSIKKNGEKCNAIVNISTCEFCIYHIKQEYQKCSKRSELQANFVGKGLTALRNKVLGKNEVFYAGKSYMAVPAKKSRKMAIRDESIMDKLNGINVNSNPIVKAKNTANKKKRGVARHLDVSPAQRLRDLELLKRLGGGIESKTNFSGTHSAGVTLESSKTTALDVISKLKAKKPQVTEVPKLTSQYDMKADLIVNVETKKNFTGTMSEGVTLEESKNTALSVISKLKAKNSKPESTSKTKKNEEEQQSIEEMLSAFECDEFNYDDEFENSVKPKETNATSKNQSTFTHTSPLTSSGKSAVNNDIDKTSKSDLKSPVPSTSKTTTISTPKTPSAIGGKSNSSTPTHLNSTPKSVTKNKLSTPKSSNSLNLFDAPKLTSPSSSKKSSENTNLLQNLSKVDSPANRAGKTNLESSVSEQFLSAVTKKTTNHVPNSSKTAINSGNGMIIPKLSGFSNNGVIDLNAPIPKKNINKAKLNALNFIQKHGPIKKADPNSTKSSGRKRPIAEILSENGVDLGEAAKKSKLQESEFISERWKKMMAATSKHQNLIEEHYDEEQEKYFKKLEIKEKMEEKMTTTYKVACKAVRCLKCKYTSFSASDMCKAEGHPLRVFDAMKRFFKCGNCQNRTVSLDIVPIRPCKNCGSGKWERTGMMKEKVAVVQHGLSIRGGEQKFINSDVKDANLDLLVPDDGA